MTKGEWKEAYIRRLMERGGVDRSFAEDTYLAAEDDHIFGGHDFEDDPVAAADEEMSYWEE